MARKVKFKNSKGGVFWAKVADKSVGGAAFGLPVTIIQVNEEEATPIVDILMLDDVCSSIQKMGDEILEIKDVPDEKQEGVRSS